jgi:orotate phosphoribosyltransferase
MADIMRKTAGYLLQSKAIILEPSNPFTWASGWRSPIYCDNRLTLSYPEIRDFIKGAFRDLILEHFGKPGLIAGVATGAIAHGALVADLMDLPFVYVRTSAKGHGRMNQVEGRLEPGQLVVVVEDLVSTGSSSLKAVEAIREAGAEVMGMVAIFTYGFEMAAKAFEDTGVKLFTLCDYPALLDQAVRSGTIGDAQLGILEQWREDPSSWKGTVQ